MLNIFLNPEVSDTTGDAKRFEAGYKKISVKLL